MPLFVMKCHFTQLHFKWMKYKLYPAKNPFQTIMFHKWATDQTKSTWSSSSLQLSAEQFVFGEHGDQGLLPFPPSALTDDYHTGCILTPHWLFPNNIGDITSLNWWTSIFELLFLHNNIEGAHNICCITGYWLYPTNGYSLQSRSGGSSDPY